MALKKVAEIEICGEKFDLAKNGRFTLVRTSPDAYGEPRGTEVEMEVQFLDRGSLEDGFRAVIDLLGEAYQALAQARAMRLGGEPGDRS